MTSNLCSHTTEIQYLVATSTSRLHRRAPVASMQALVDVAEEVRQRCRTECGDASPYPADARRVEEAPTTRPGRRQGDDQPGHRVHQRP
ncbi:hypothetical protein ACFXGA_27055 [Actinosynnema sp. NPDC059335]|uniref:hypothetical protein n=1 Tax=Actinosynnema sp. NPDC059335 TaxID=3346804 RepID=UPI00366B0364